MVNLYKDYPHGMTNREISKTVTEYSKEIFAAQGQLNSVIMFTSLIILGQTELQGRTTKRIAYLSAGIALLSLLVSSAALYVSVNR